MTILITISCNVISSIFKICAIDPEFCDTFSTSLQISLAENEVVKISTICLTDNLFTLFSTKKISVTEFENVELDQPWSITLDKEIIKKIILLTKWYPKNLLQMSLDVDVVTIDILGTDNLFRVSIQTDVEPILEPDFLRPDCLVEPSELKRALEFIHVQDVNVTLELNKDTNVLKILNETGFVCKINVLNSKKNQNFTLCHKFIPFLINRLASIKNNCNLYINCLFTVQTEDTLISLVLNT